jgi:hypothetical protein
MPTFVNIHGMVVAAAYWNDYARKARGSVSYQ